MNTCYTSISEDGGTDLLCIKNVNEKDILFHFLLQ